MECLNSVKLQINYRKKKLRLGCFISLVNFVTRNEKQRTT